MPIQEERLFNASVQITQRATVNLELAWRPSQNHPSFRPALTLMHFFQVGLFCAQFARHLPEIPCRHMGGDG
jgi:hypothetical protein